MPISRRWNENQQGERITAMFLDKIKSQEPLKLRIEEAQNKLQIQISKLDKLSANLHEKDRVIFDRIVQSIQSPDSYYAKILSSELSQVRKMNKIVDSAKIAFEQIQLRLDTVTELGDIVVTLSPAMSVIQGIQGGLSSMMPKANQSFGEMSELFGSIMAQSTQIPTIAGTEMVTNTELSEEAIKIMEEANTIIEENTKGKFPDLSSLSSGDKEEVKSSYSPSYEGRQTST